MRFKTMNEALTDRQGEKVYEVTICFNNGKNAMETSHAVFSNMFEAMAEAEKVFNEYDETDRLYYSTKVTEFRVTADMELDTDSAHCLIVYQG